MKRPTIQNLIDTAKANAKALEWSKDKEPPKDRITLNFNLHHQHWQDMPTSVELLGLELILDSAEQPYSRRVTIGEDWQPIIPSRCDIELDQLGLIIVQNLEGWSTGRKPSTEQKAEIAKKVIEIGFGEGSPSIIVPTKWVQPILSKMPQAISIRSLCGDTSCKITVFPK